MTGLQLGRLPASRNILGSQASIGGQGNGSKEVAPPDTTQWQRGWPPWRYGPTRAALGGTAGRTGGKVRRDACPPANKTGAGSSRLAAASDPTGPFADGARERICYREEGGACGPAGLGRFGGP